MKIYLLKNAASFDLKKIHKYWLILFDWASFKETTFNVSPFPKKWILTHFVCVQGLWKSFTVNVSLFPKCNKYWLILFYLPLNSCTSLKGRVFEWAGSNAEIKPFSFNFSPIQKDINIGPHFIWAWCLRKPFLLKCPRFQNRMNIDSFYLSARFEKNYFFQCVTLPKEQ